MTAGTAAVSSAARPAGLPDDPVGRLRSLLDPGFLSSIGWDADAQVLVPPPEHPLMGYRICSVIGCTVATRGALVLCPSCQQRYSKTGSSDLDVFIAAGRPPTARMVGEFFCAVPGCARTQANGTFRLCDVHATQQRNHLQLPLAAFIAHPRVKPLPGLGPCKVGACGRVATVRIGLCRAHVQTWRKLQHRETPVDFAAWCRTAPPVLDGVTVVLRGLPELVQLQLLYGLQTRTDRGTKTKLYAIRRLVQALRESQTTSLLDPDASVISGHRDYIQFAGEMRILVGRAFATPDTERYNDVWDMGVFGLGNKSIDYRKITQPWLRAAVKCWVFEEIPTRYGRDVSGTLRTHVNDMILLSDSLRQHRHDHGDDPTALGRKDVTVFLNGLGRLEATGQLSAKQRIGICRHVALVLRECRALGLARREGPMAGLADDFALRPGDAPTELDEDSCGRSLPADILRQLAQALPLLEKWASREIRVAVELLMHTGRRPDEVCKLPWDCLEQGADGKHVLIYTNFKLRRLDRRLPISDAPATLIRDQQHRVRTRFPNTPLAELPLLPAATSNPNGTVPLSDMTLGSAHRKWVTRLPALVVHDAKGRDVEFDKAQVVPYAYRHSYAQRHADAGTPVDVLCELMDHRSMDTTRGYYRITERRTRTAIDKLFAYQFDRHGDAVWQQAERLLETEHQRLRIGQVVVPFGTCSEPSNVQAGGGACPFRFRCLGCGHFRTDPSYLPELRAYLDTLLRDRERLRSATVLEDWARTEATPSEVEISRLRALIRKIERAVSELDADERGQIEQATRTLRATRRTVHLGMPSIRSSDPALSPPGGAGEPLEAEVSPGTRS